jgi:hypothetical protein
MQPKERAMSDNRRTVETRQSMLPRRDRYRQAAALLRQWQSEQGVYDEQTWSVLEKESKDSALPLY